MKGILIFACLILLIACQQVLECDLDPTLVLCSPVVTPVCGVKSNYKKKTYSNHCIACVMGQAAFTVEGACEEYPKNAKFCSPKEKKARFCTREYFPHCGWFDHNIQCKGIICAATGSNRCETCKIEHVLYTIPGKCPIK